MLYGLYVDTDLEILGMKGFELKFGDLNPGKVLEKSLKFVSEKGLNFGKRSCLWNQYKQLLLVVVWCLLRYLTLADVVNLFDLLLGGSSQLTWSFL